MIRELESQGVVSKTHSPFNSPIWPVRKSEGGWRLTVDYCALNEVTPPLNTAVPDMLELQYELEPKAVKCQIVSPLYLVTCKKNDFHWGPEQQQAFDQIKQENAHVNIKSEPQAELPEAQSAIMAVERRKKEDMRRIQEEIHLHQHRGNQQKHTIKEDVQAELQESEDRNKERVRRLEEEMKIIREKLNRLPWALQKQVTKVTAISPMAPSAPGEDAKKEQNEQDNHMRPAVVTAQPDHPKRVTKGTAVSPMAPSAPGEEGKEKQREREKQKQPSVLTAQAAPCKRVLVEKEQDEASLSEMPCQAQGELFPAREQEEQLRQQVEEPQQNGQNMKSEPQAELPEAQSAIMVLKRRNKDEIRRIQEEIHLHQHRSDQQNQ
ncbi:involucrin-like [Passer domesticus]|uniref:involucrin-like n=1 Tax=Passer domesticus TaxID=48849 RepID=UPI0030FE2EF4